MIEYTAVGLVDIRTTSSTIVAYVGDSPVVSMTQGKPWTVECDADLANIIRAAVTLLEFETRNSVATIEEVER